MRRCACPAVSDVIRHPSLSLGEGEETEEAKDGVSRGLELNWFGRRAGLVIGQVHFSHADTLSGARVVCIGELRRGGGGALRRQERRG